MTAKISPPGQPTRTVPVVRVVFDAPSMFAAGSDTLTQEAGTIVSSVADNLRRDVPDVQLTVVGHTDAAGGVALNRDLAQRRAEHVLRALIAAGTVEQQLSAVPMGERQPVASNATPAGRARNRRVEFFISASLAANKAAIEDTPVRIEWLRGDEPAGPGGTRVAVLRPHASRNAGRLAALAGAAPIPAGALETGIDQGTTFEQAATVQLHGAGVPQPATADDAPLGVPAAESAATPERAPAAAPAPPPATTAT